MGELLKHLIHREAWREMQHIIIKGVLLLKYNFEGHHFGREAQAFCNIVLLLMSHRTSGALPHVRVVKCNLGASSKILREKKPHLLVDEKEVLHVL